MSLYLHQLSASIASLRRFNNDIPVYVFACGLPAGSTRYLPADPQTHVIHMADYNSLLRAYCGERADVFALYPVLHRWLVLKEFAHSGYDALLYLDNDTYFFSDPALLFAQYGTSDWYAREEPFSTRSHLGYRSEYVDETALESVAKQLCSRLMPTMNLGVILMNHRSWERVTSEVLNDFFDYMWRFWEWLVYHPRPQILTDPRIQPVIAEVAKRGLLCDPEAALPYPSSNGWIVDQLSMLLAVGRVSRWSCGLLSPFHAMQGYEFANPPTNSAKPSEAVLCHYFTRNYGLFMRAMKNGKTS